MNHNFLYVVLAVSILGNVCQFFYPGEGKENGYVRRALTAGSAVEQLKAMDTKRASIKAQSHPMTKYKTQIVDGVEVPAGIRKIFIDLGANDGASTSFFLRPNDKEGNIAMQGGGKDSFMEGLGSSGDWEVVIFEANTNFTEPLHLIREDAMTQGWAKNITVFAGTAISKHTGTVSFIIDNDFSGSAGATTMPESTSAVGPHFTIPSVGILDLFHHMHIRQNDFVILKMDIEGAEFDLLRYMVVHGLHNRIDILAVEYHDENYFVFGKDPVIQQKYTALHKCLDWVTEEIKSMKIINWGR